MRNVSANQQGPSAVARPSEFSQSIDWYAEGETRVVEVNGVRIEVRFVGRHGRRCRIAITAPPGAVFRSTDERARR
jgi:hypothetical protein